MTGTFITFEGPEGAGKTTQLARLAERLRAIGREVVETREPGGTKGGEAVRAALIATDASWSPVAEALLMNAARDAHLRDVIAPALERGAVVLCDRFSDSTRAYQGGGSDVDPDFLLHLEDAVVTRRPDVTLIFDLPVEEGLSRAMARGAADRFEQKGPAYHARVAEAFRDIAKSAPHYALVDASGSMDVVEARIVDHLRDHLPGLKL